MSSTQSHRLQRRATHDISCLIADWSRSHSFQLIPHRDQTVQQTSLPRPRLFYRQLAMHVRLVPISGINRYRPQQTPIPFQWPGISSNQRFRNSWLSSSSSGLNKKVLQSSHSASPVAKHWHQENPGWTSRYSWACLKQYSFRQFDFPDWNTFSAAIGVMATRCSYNNQSDKQQRATKLLFLKILCSRLHQVKRSFWRSIMGKSFTQRLTR